jgi:hypothetical protein
MRNLMSDVQQPANEKVLLSLKRPSERLLSPPDSGSFSYWNRGCHPDIVERIWQQLAAPLGSESRCLIYGTPSLICPATGLILAVGYGTAYCVRVPIKCQTEAVAAGAKISQQWSGGSTTNIQDEFGSDWFFGAWLKQELAWIEYLCKSEGIAGS